MAKLSIVAGTTSKLVDVFIQDSSSTTGAGLTGLVWNTASLAAYYYREGAASAVSMTPSQTMTLGTWVSLGFIVVDGTNMPGAYQIGLPNAAIAAGAKSVIIMLRGATNMAPCVLEIELTATDNQDAVHGGMSALPNTACTTNGSLITSGTGTDQLSVTSGRTDVGKALGTAVTLDSNNVLNVSTKYVGGTSQTARDLGASVLLSAGTGTGQIDFTSGVVKSNLSQILGTALTETAGLIAAGFKQFFNIASPTSTMNTITAVTTTTTATNLTNAPTAGDFTATMKTSLNSATPAVTVSDKTGFSLSGAGIQAIWDALTSALTTVGSIGKLLVTNLDALISSRSTYAGGDTSGTTTLLTRIPGTVQPQTGDSYERLGAPAGASVSADIAAVPTANANADALLDRANGVETSITLRQAQRVQLAAAAGKLDGAATTTIHLRDQADSKNRITATVDSSGNRSAITLDLT